MKPANRILHVDGDSFFASCEIALDPGLEGTGLNKDLDIHVLMPGRIKSPDLGAK